MKKLRQKNTQEINLGRVLGAKNARLDSEERQ